MKIVIIVFLIYCFKSILTETKVKIHENEMPDEMKDHAIALAVEEFEKNTDLDAIASKISNEFNTLYGNDWYCFIGPMGTVSHFNAMPNTLLRFSSELTQVLLFKPSFVTQKNLISNALRNTTKVTVIKSEMNVEMQTNLLDTTLTALKLFDNYELIAKNISDSLDATYGKYWNCFVGHNETYAYARYVNKTYISFIVGELQFVLFQTSEPIQKTDYSTTIKEARNATPEVLDSHNLSEEEKNSIINIIKDYISQNITDCDIETYEKRFPQDNCYYKYHLILEEKIQSKFNFTYVTYGRKENYAESLGLRHSAKIIDIGVGNLVFVLAPLNLTEF